MYVAWVRKNLSILILIVPVGICIPVAGMLAAEPGVTFSHELHLSKTPATCLTCHAAVVASAAASDNLLPTEASCLTCHNGRQAPDACGTCHPGVRPPMAVQGYAERKRTVIFNHQQHLEIGGLPEIISAGMQSDGYPPDRRMEQALIDPALVCSACHRGMHRMETLTAEALPAMADCLLCHQGSVPEETCRTCHTPDHEFKPASHTFNFIDEHQATTDFVAGQCFVCHSENYCAKCHGG